MLEGVAVVGDEVVVVVGVHEEARALGEDRLQIADRLCPGDIGGAVIQWLRDGLKIIKDSAESTAKAVRVPDTGGVYIVPAFTGLCSPYWDMYARGAIVGLTRYATKAHLVRATLEAICYQTREVLDAMRRDSGVELKVLKVDGGMVVNELLMQFQADILGVPVVRPRVAETTALGAAYTAGLAAGFWASPDELRGQWMAERTWQPAMPATTRDRLMATWRKAVERTYGWLD